MTNPSPKTVWITRTEPGASELAERLVTLGYHPVIAPLLRLGPPATLPPPVEPQAILIFTSPNGVRAFAQSEAGRDHTVIALAPATADVARQVGFRDIHIAGETSGDVTAYIRRKFPQGHPAGFLHISGQHIRGTIIEDLQTHTYRAARRIYYAAQAVADNPLSEAEIKNIDAVMLYSPRAAQTLCKFEIDTAHMQAVYISAATAQMCQTMDFQAHIIAQSPHDAAMCDALKHVSTLD